MDGNVPPLISDSELVFRCRLSSGSRWSSSGGAWRLASSEPDPKIQPSVPGMMRCDGSCHPNKSLRIYSQFVDLSQRFW